MLLLGSLGLLVGTQVVDYHSSPFLKHLFYGGFIASMACSLVPLINMAALPIIYDALFATGFTMAALGLVAYNAPNEQFLQWGGALGMGLGAMIGIGLI
jgi:FtsH-binding integral membrane protein